MLFGIGHQFSRDIRSHFPPRGDDLDARLQRVGAQFSKAHLVVALAGRAMQMASAPVSLTISIRRLAISGRAMEVPSRYSP